MKIFELFKSLQYNGQWHQMSSSHALYATLARAQAQVIGAGPWVKDARRRIWRTEHHDRITERKVIP